MRSDVVRASGGALVAPIARLMGAREPDHYPLGESEVAAHLYGRRFSSAGARSPVGRSQSAPGGAETRD